MGGLHPGSATAPESSGGNKPLMTTLPSPIMPGAYYDVPDPDYRTAEGVSNSMLKVFRERASAEYAQARLAKPKDATDALRFGIALHGSLLTPEVKPTWVVLPEDAPKYPTNAQRNAKKPSKKTLAAINWWNKFEHDSKGLHVLSHEQGVRLEKTIEAFKRHPLAPKTIEHGNAEVSVFAPFSFGGTVMRKARMDFVTDGPAIVDLKTATDCSPALIGKRDEFERTIYDLDYDMQAAFYLDLWNDANPTDKKDIFVFVAMDWDEDTQVVGIRVMPCKPDIIKSGRDKYTEALTKWIGCSTSGNWPGYPETLEAISIPEFAAKKYRTLI